ncbi:MAG: thiamine pyrophosphate-dependent enzyme [Pseudomonadota bacterium]
MDRAEIVHQNFLTRVRHGDLPSTALTTLAQADLTPTDLVELFHAQVLSRQLDRTSRHLQAKGQGFYTIGSSGHEGNAAIAWALRPNDMAFLHYRDAAFQIARSRQVPGQTPLWDMLLSFTAGADDPISGGRHKVLGSKTLYIPPQTSTIASHLPKAVGAAYSIGLARKVKPSNPPLSADGIVLCSFGDASLNHSTAQGALNTASWTAYQSTPLPLLFVCEDNGLGISVKTPKDWVEASVSTRPGLRYVQCDGLDVVATFAAARETAEWVRKRKKPAFLHMRCVRLYGHAGPDAASAYLSKVEIEADEARDPLLFTARRLIDEGVMTPAEIAAAYEAEGARVARAAETAAARPKLKSANDVIASLIPPKRETPERPRPSANIRTATFSDADIRAMAEPQHMAKLINFALTDLLLEHHDIVLAGEDIGRKGGVYGVTQKLQKRFGAHRVVDTLLDEQSILGLGVGLAHNDILAIPEIQFLAYLHNAEDQLRGEAATLPFFSNGQYTNPIVVRIAGLGYQKGFGGHFHNDNSIAVMRDIPGLIIACPSNGRDAALMLRECVRLAREEQRLIVFLEPIALYMTRDLHETGDGGWTFDYPTPTDDATTPIGAIGTHNEAATDLAIVSYANGYYLSRQAEKILHKEDGVNAKVIDLRWLAPLPEQALLEATKDCKKILIVDECRRTGSQSEALTTLFLENGRIDVARVAAEDSFIATGPAYGATLPSRDGIIAAARALLKEPSR